MMRGYSFDPPMLHQPQLRPLFRRTNRRLSQIVSKAAAVHIRRERVQNTTNYRVRTYWYERPWQEKHYGRKC